MIAANYEIIDPTDDVSAYNGPGLTFLATSLLASEL